jgi:hypothetical protein
MYQYNVNMNICKVIFPVIGILICDIVNAQKISECGLYRTFERSLENSVPYSNKFTDVTLFCTFKSPSGYTVDFYGFFDGDGKGGGDRQNGFIWKIRYLPDETGIWKYSWSWSDGTPGGKDSLRCVSTGSGKGILRAYNSNPRWFAYNGIDPVWLKSYYESGHGALSQPFEWIAENVYQPVINQGYNHLQVNWLLSLCCFDQFYHDGPAQSTADLSLYENKNASGTMHLDVWHKMEQHVAWLNDRNIGLHMFLGFDGSRNGGPEWETLDDKEKEFYVRYVIARLAPFANIAGWNFVWEVPGDRVTHELGWARLVEKYDIFGHLRTYHDENPGINEYTRQEYTFAAVENHLMFSTDKETDRLHWKEPWTHHNACLAGYVPGKPVFMTEGNALWRRYWQNKCGATTDDLRQAAWACVTAGASFTWCGHEGEGPLVTQGCQGLPFFNDSNVYALSAKQIDILSFIMNHEVVFYRMAPSDSLLSGHDPHQVWCLSEPGVQYLVFAANGSPYSMQLSTGIYDNNQWIDSKTGNCQRILPLSVSEKKSFSFSPPDTATDWILLIRKNK